MAKQTILIVILVILLVAAVGYIAYGLFNAHQQKKIAEKQNEQMKLFQQGYEFGVAQLINEAAKCDLDGVPVTYKNITIRVVALECIQAAQRAQQAPQQAQQ
jgi:Tfp pilus assembly protein PilO